MRLRRFVLTAVMLAVFSLGIVPGIDAQSSSAPAQTTPSSAAPKTAGEVFKNVQVLKEMPSTQMLPTMRVISGSLGVQCQFCHSAGDFSSDEKMSKQTARKMMQMVQSVNKDFFNGERAVTCYTCHRGSPMPLTAPAAPEQKGPATPAAPTAPSPEQRPPA